MASAWRCSHLNRALYILGVQMKFPHWQHFLSLEKDFIKTIEFVELTTINGSTHSVVFTKLLLSICSEVDVVAKMICQNIDPTSSANNINNYRTEITGKYVNFHTVECLIPRYGITVNPWESWEKSENPQWWREHNDVKHNRSSYSHLANQRNVKEALCGLFTLLLYLYHEELYNGELTPFPALLDYEKMPGNVIVNLGAELPGIPR